MQLPEIQGFVLNDLAIASIEIFDPALDSANATCADLACNETGNVIYALILDPPAAYIRTYRFVNRKPMWHTYIPWRIPFDDGILIWPDEERAGIIASEGENPSNWMNLTDTQQMILRTNFLEKYFTDSSDAEIHKSGSVHYISQTTPGGSLVYKNNRLYAITYRQFNLAYYRRAELMTATTNRTPPNPTIVPCWATVMHTLHGIDGHLIAKNWLSKVGNFASGPVGGGGQDPNASTYTNAVFNGASAYDNKIILGKRQDSNCILNTLEFYPNVINPIPNIWHQRRGHGEIVTIPIPSDTTKYKYLPQTSLYVVYPFDLTMPASLTSDDSERKLFASIGGHIWTFDALDYTIVVQYEDGIAYGDIIDLGDILDAIPKAIRCFIRNDSTSLMEDVQIRIHLAYDNPRRDDIFLNVPPEPEGFKHIRLGNIVPGGSKEFIVRAYALNVQDQEKGFTYRVPLYIEYKRNEYN